MLYFHQKKLLFIHLSIHKGVLLKWSEKTLEQDIFHSRIFSFHFYYKPIMVFHIYIQSSL